MRRSARLLATIATGLLLLASTALPASAATPIWMVCQPGEPAITGSITGFSNITSLNLYAAAYRLEVNGWIKGCHPALNSEHYALAVYTGSQMTSSGWASAYSRQSSVGWIELGEGDKAVCLLKAANSRVDCIQVIWQTQTGGRPKLPVAGPHIGNSSLVSYPITGFSYMQWPATQVIPDPTCPGCWGGPGL